MTWPFESSVITAGFDQPRPLSVPPAERTHVHGAIDVPVRVGSAIRAPEAGMLHYWAAFRSDATRAMNELGDAVADFPFNWMGRSYFYDTFGGCVVLLGQSGFTHIITHSYMNQLFNYRPHALKWVYIESPRHERWPVSAWYTTNGVGHHVPEGSVIAASGNAGYSTGPHVHYEVHRAGRWQPHEDRPRPESLYE